MPSQHCIWRWLACCLQYIFEIAIITTYHMTVGVGLRSWKFRFWKNLAGFISHLNEISRLETEMNLNVLSAERFEEGQYGQRRSIEQGRGGSVLWGGLLASGETEDDGSSSPTEIRPRVLPKDNSSKPGSGEENGTRQRGRPRLDTRDKTAAEVGFSVSWVVFNT